MIQSEGSIWDLILVFALVFLASLFMGWLSARILDVRRGRVRSLVAGVIGFFGGLALLAVQVDGNVEIDFETDSNATFLLVLAWLGYALIVALVASLVIDAMLRPRRGRRRFPRPIRAIKARIAVTRRLTQIARIARSNGLIGRRLASRSELLSPETARALRLTLEESGGMLVKFGQIASTRDDLLPPVITDELAQLRSSVPGLPFATVRSMVEILGGGNAANMWGPWGSPQWAAHDPLINAEKLRGTALFISTGNGLPGPVDGINSLAMAAGVVPGAVLEGITNMCTAALQGRFGQLGIPATFSFRPEGTHTWGLFEADMRASWPMIAGAIGA